MKDSARPHPGPPRGGEQGLFPRGPREALIGYLSGLHLDAVSLFFFFSCMRVKEFVYTNPYRESVTDYSTQVFTHGVQTMQWSL